MVAPHKLQFCKLLGNINAFPSSQSLGWGRSKFRNTHATEIEGQCFVCRGILEHERSGEEKDPFRNLFAINKPWLLLQYFHRKSPQRCVLITKCQKKICCGMKQKNVFPCLQHGQFWVLGKQRPFSPESDTLGCSAYLGSSMVGMYGGHDHPWSTWGLTLTQMLAHAHRVTASTAATSRVASTPSGPPCRTQGWAPKHSSPRGAKLVLIVNSCRTKAAWSGCGFVLL